MCVGVCVCVCVRARAMQGQSNGIAGPAQLYTSGWQKKEQTQKPARRSDVNMTEYSFVLKNPLRCAALINCCLHTCNSHTHMQATHTRARQGV